MQLCWRGSLTPRIPTTLLVEFILHPLSAEKSLLYMTHPFYSFNLVVVSDDQLDCPHHLLPANRHMVLEYLFELPVLLRASTLID